MFLVEMGLEEDANLKDLGLGVYVHETQVKEAFLWKLNGWCRFISSDCRALNDFCFRGLAWVAVLIVKLSTVWVMASIAMAPTANVPDFCVLGINLISFLTIEAYAFLYLIRGNQFSSLVNRLSTLWVVIKKEASTPEELRIVVGCERTMRFYAAALNCGALAILLGYTSAPVIKFILTSDENKKMGLPFKMAVLVFSEDSIFVYIITAFCLTYACFLIINIDAMYLSMLSTLEAGFLLNGLNFVYAYRHSRIIGQLNLLKGQYTQSLSQTLDADLRDTLIQHQQWLRVASELKTSLRDRMLVLHAGTIAVTTLGSFLTATDPSHHLSQIAMAFVPLTIYYLFFHQSSRVASAIMATADLVYSNHMILPDCTKLDPKPMLFAIARSRKPVLLDAGKLLTLTLPKFVLVLQHIYSSIMLLRFVNLQAMDPQLSVNLSR